MRSILFKLSQKDADDLDAVFEYFREVKSGMTTPRKLFLHAVSVVMAENNLSVHVDDNSYVKDSWVPPDKPKLTVEQQVEHDAELAALLD